MKVISTDETRFVLNGIRFEVKPKRQPILVAVDGRRMVVIESEAAQSLNDTPIENESPAEFTLKASIAKTIISLSKTVGKALFPWVCLEIPTGSSRLIASLVGPDVHLEIKKEALIEGNFPNWKGVIPAKKDDRKPVAEVAVMAPYLADFAKAAKALNSEAMALAFNITEKDSAIEVSIKDKRNFYGVVMPYKIEDSFNFQPDFLKAA